ncbi:hypothetical protein TNCV_1632261 [Trichonephila clavipes]|nr:hypothetical protein TNCV_1632261 [Trichonephila clavipes]
MGSLRYTGIEAAINGMAAFIIPEESEIQTNSFCSENHVHCVLGQKGCVAGRFFDSRRHDQCSSVLCDLTKTAPRNSKQKAWHAESRCRFTPR